MIAATANRLPFLRRAALASRAAVKAYRLGYEAVEDSTRRKTVTVNLGSEDEILKTRDRDKLVSSTRQLRRNSALCAWLIRKHLDFVSTFTFQCTHPDPELRQDVEDFVAWWGRAENCDAAGRHPLRRLIRLSEAHRSIEGDDLHVRLADGRLQVVAGPRIRTPAGRNSDTEIWRHGVRVNKAGAALAYAVHTRNALKQWELDRIVPAENAVLHGYFDTLEQVRGVPPLAASVNPLTDTHANIDLALARAKVATYFALKIFTERDLGQDGIDLPGTPTEDATGREVTVDFGAGPQLLNLDAGENAEFLESHQPSTEFVQFHESVIALALLCCDLPLTFLWPHKTNFVGQQSGLQLYKMSADSKRADNVELLTGHTLWRLRLAVLNGELELPSGTTVDDLPFEWVPIGIPWWDKSKQIRGDLMAIAAGLDNPQRVSREHGTDFVENVDRIADALKYAREKLGEYGVSLRWDAQPELAVVVPAGEEGADD
jgi:capsid protein